MSPVPQHPVARRHPRLLTITIVAVLSLLVVIVAPSSAVGAVAPGEIYTDVLHNEFQNWSWAETDLKSTSQVHSGSNAISVDYGPWEGIYLADPSPAALSPHAVLKFWMHGGDGTAATVFVALTNGSQQRGPIVEIMPVPGRWTEFTLPVTELGQPSRLGGIWWQNGTNQTRPTMFVDDIRFVEGAPPPAADGPELRVELGARTLLRSVTDPASGRISTVEVDFPHVISHDVYGLNFAAPELRREISPGVNRWGGNAVERFNHTNGTTNVASDYYFMSNPGSGPGDDHAFENDNQAAGTATLLTVPATGWVAKDRQARCGYPLDRYGPMDASATHWLDAELVCGNGKRDGAVVAGDPETTSRRVGAGFTRRWVRDLVDTHGTAASGGVESYAIGNEPGLWHLTHADIVDTPMTRQAIISTNLMHAAAVKDADPTAAVAGPVLWSGFSYYVTSAEFDAGRRPGDVPTFVESYLQAMAEAESDIGDRLLDTLAINFYDDRVYSGGDDQLRLEATRSLWDTSYAPQDWWVIRDFVAEGHAVIPRMQSLIADNYPGTELTITEYNFGGLDSLAGGLAQADALGIFGREGLDAAMLWDPFNAELSPPEAEFIDRPGMWAFRMYRNYDGAGARFGDQSVFAESDDQAAMAVYAATRDDGAVTVMVINKSTSPQESPLRLDGVTGRADVYRYSGADLHAIEQLEPATIADGVTLTYPGRSITLLVIDPTGTAAPPPPQATPTAQPLPTPTAAQTPTAVPTTQPIPTPTLPPTPTATPTPNPTPTAEPTPTAVPEPTAEPTPTATPADDPVGPCVRGVPAGAIEGQPEFVGCRSLIAGPETAVAGPNRWSDDFDHGLSFASADTASYRVFDGLGVEGSVHWRHADHWMVDVATRETGGITGGAMLSPNQAFGFEDGVLIIEADAVAGHPDYANAWPELVITTGDAPTERRRDGLYGYDHFRGDYTLGCRLQNDTNTICSLMDSSSGDGPGAGRIWEMSWFQQVGETKFGGSGFVDNGSHFRSCGAGDPDVECRDRFRLELTRTSLTIYVNGLLYFEQTGIPALPDELLEGEIYVYFASMLSRHTTDSIRFHWVRLAVNPSTAPSASPTWD